MDTYTYNCTNTDTDTDIYTDIHPFIVVARVLAPTHMAKDCFEDVRLCVVIIVTLCVIVQTSMGNATINIITIFAVAAATRRVVPTCGDITDTKSGCKPFSGCDAAGSMCTIINHIYLSRGTCAISMSRYCVAGCTNVYTIVPLSMIDSGARGRGARGGALRCTCSAVHEAFSI